MTYIKQVGMVAVFVCSATIAWGCSLAPEADRMQPIEVNFNNRSYTNVFMGTVVSREDGDVPEGPTYTIEVGETYRGNLSGTIEVSSAGHSCGSFYDEGTQMIWFMKSDTSYVDETNPQYRVSSRQEAQELVDGIAVEGVSTSQAPSTCKVWYDGCNTCTRSAIDEGFACTEMACQVQEQAECRSYFTPEEGAPYVAGPTSAPGDDFVGPTTPPPSYEEEEDTEPLPWWQRLWQWIKGLFN